MSDGYGGGGQWFEKIREAIATFINLDTASTSGAATAAGELELDASIRSLLEQGRKIDAISLVRTRKQLDLSQAVQRVNDVEKRMSSGN